jgi:hypothetical protein
MDESSGVNVSAAGSDPGRSVQEASNSPGCPIEPRNDIPPGPREEASADGGDESAEPVRCG